MKNARLVKQSNSTTLIKNKRRILIIGIIVLLLSVVAYNYKIILGYSVYHLNVSHYKPGDKLYALGTFVNSNKSDAIVIYKIARPLTATDLDQMTISTTDKDRLKSKIDPSLEPFMVMSDDGLINDSLYKYKTAYVGTVLNRVSHKLIDHYNRDIYRINFVYYEITANKNALIKEYYSSGLPKIPDNYVLVKDKVYISAGNVTNKEVKEFHKK
ncbi:hypothetical protein [Mucilaginibacter pocheonensis]|uniref:Uncharacterized protein n=1 Tax=Mucilaginibacter pocheonensis TaxID=398050 RepID=A0ABU1TGY2_9SPHI|nr:hypothetical protein [Mucilaginibacter pocheonensis]MDR6944688.1 hypothetical protein [Mucilaginibacter pocheonensis]